MTDLQMNTSAVSGKALFATSRDEPLTMSSREIAELVESRHDKVKQSIERLVARGTIVQPPMGDEQSTDSMGRLRSEAVYHLNKRDSYVVVAQLSPEFTARLVDRWQELEDGLASAPIDYSSPQVMLGVLEALQQKTEEQAEQIADMKPKADFHDQFVNADGFYGLENAGRAAGLYPKKFVNYLKIKHLFYQGGQLMPYVQYRKQGLFHVKTTMVDDKARSQTFITPKGLAYFARTVPDHLRLESMPNAA